MIFVFISGQFLTNLSFVCKLQHYIILSYLFLYWYNLLLLYFTLSHSKYIILLCNQKYNYLDKYKNKKIRNEKRDQVRLRKCFFSDQQFTLKAS